MKRIYTVHGLTINNDLLPAFLLKEFLHGIVSPGAPLPWTQEFLLQFVCKETHCTFHLLFKIVVFV